MSYETIKAELKDHLIQCVNDGVINEDNFKDAHFYAFNEDYYIIGYYQASQWLEEHNLDPFEAISICHSYERDNFGGLIDPNKYNNSESVVNMIAYIFGEDITPFSDSWESFKDALDIDEESL